jgi:hypothetical protein
LRSWAAAECESNQKEGKKKGKEIERRRKIKEAWAKKERNWDHLLTIR